MMNDDTSPIQLPPAEMQSAELIGCPTQTYQPSWQVLPHPEPKPAERTMALHPNGHWYDLESGHLLMFLRPTRAEYRAE